MNDPKVNAEVSDVAVLKEQGEILALALSPDGKTLAFANAKGKVKLITVEKLRKDHAVDRHACLCQDLRVHNHDVGHREESREATQQLLPYVCLVLCQPEISTDQMRFLD